MLNMYSTVDSFRFFLTHFVLIPEIVRLNIRYYLRISLGVFSAIAGLIFLSKSSFFAVQLEDTKSSEIFAFAVLSALLIFLVLAARSLNDILRKVWNINVFIKAMVHCLFLGMVWLLAFLIKYPRFNVHSKYRKSCLVEQGNKDISFGSEFNLYAVGAFALLALLLSWKRHKRMELGFFGILIGLIMDASMEIPVDNDTPNLWYLFGAFLFCIGLIFIRRYINHAKEEGRAGGGHRRLSNVLRNSLEFFSAIVGVVCLFLSPFCKLQFEDAENVKAVCFITFSLVLGALLLKAPTFIDILADKCHRHFAVKTIVNFFFLMVVSGVIFMTKYPRFKINSKYFGESCEDVKGKKLASLHGNEFDMYSAGAFSLFALTISSERRQPMKLDVFAFLLELTMDTSIEVLGKGGQNFFYMPCAAIYCVLLILVRSLMDSSIERRGGSDNQLHEIVIGTLDGGETRAIGDDQSLIVRKSTNQEEKDHGLSGDGEIEGEEGDDPIISEDTHIDYESPLGVVSGVRLSHLEDGLTQAFRRSKANKREKAKRERERRRERRKEKESLWIS